MVRCEVIKDFTLEKFNELKNIQRKLVDTNGKLYVGDVFECEQEIADYLLGQNKLNLKVVKLIEAKEDKKETKKQEKIEKSKSKTTKKKKQKTVVK